MKTFYVFLFSITFLLPNINFAQYTETINSNIPGMSMSPYAVGKTLIQTEMNMYYLGENNSVYDPNQSGKGFGGNIALRYGVWKEEFEAVITAEYRSITYPQKKELSYNGLRSFTAGAKYLFYDPFKNYKEETNVYSWKANQKFKWKRLKPAISAYLGANINLGNKKFSPVYPTFGPKLMVLFHNNLNHGIILTTNIFANNFLEKANYGIITTLSKGFNDKVSIFGENESFFGKYRTYVFTFGGTYILKEDLQVHATISSTPELATLNTGLFKLYGGFGCSWRFDRKYKPVELKLDGKGEKNKSKKKKEKGEKRGSANKFE